METPHYEPRLFGYTMKQWAIVFGRYQLSEPTAAGALLCRKQWQLAHNHQPGEVAIINVEPDQNWSALESILNLQWH